METQVTDKRAPAYPGTIYITTHTDTHRHTDTHTDTHTHTHTHTHMMITFCDSCTVLYMISVCSFHFR